MQLLFMISKCLQKFHLRQRPQSQKLKMTNCIRVHTATLTKPKITTNSTLFTSNNNNIEVGMTAKITAQSVQKVSNNFGSRRPFMSIYGDNNNINKQLRVLYLTLIDFGILFRRKTRNPISTGPSLIFA